MSDEPKTESRVIAIEEASTSGLIALLQRFIENQRASWHVSSCACLNCQNMRKVRRALVELRNRHYAIEEEVAMLQEERERLKERVWHRVVNVVGIGEAEKADYVVKAFEEPGR